MTRNKITHISDHLADTAAILIISLVIVLAPLRVLLVDAHFGLAWDAFAVLIMFVLLVCLARLVAAKKIRLVCLTVPILMLLGLVTVFFTAQSFVGFSGYLRLVVIVLTWPLLVFARSRYSRENLVFTGVGILVLYAVWGIAQFSLQHDLGLQSIGEVDSLAQSGVARFAGLDGARLLRAYAGYAHSNALGGSLTLGLIGLLRWSSRVHRSQARSLAWHADLLVLVLGVMMSLGIIVTMSRVALLAMAITWLIYVLVSYRKNSWRIAGRMVLVLVLIVVAFIPLFVARQSDGDDAGLSGRVSGLVGYSRLAEGSIFLSGRGLGVDAYSMALRNDLSGREIAYMEWDLDPVHSVPLLMTAELGFPVTVVLLMVCIYLVRRVSAFDIVWWLPVLPLFLLDHYLYTQLGPALMLVWLVVVCAKDTRDC